MRHDADPARHRTKTGDAYDWLRSRIEDGRFAAGVELRASELGHEMAISRTPVNAALQRLAAEGLLELVPGHGARVRSPDAADIEGAYGLRAALEGFCAGRAATTMAPEDLAELRAVQEELEQCAAENGPPGALIALNASFHRLVVEAGRNRLVFTALDRVMAATPTSTFWSHRRERDVSIIYHRQVLEAIANGDPVRAESAMRSHVLSLRSLFADHQRRADVRRVLDEQAP